MKIRIHCSDSKFGNTATIALWHGLPKSMKGRGWSTIGYHLVILNGWISSRGINKFFDGKLETGRPFDDDGIVEWWESGAHAKGRNEEIGICLIGKSGKFTEKQLNTLKHEAIPIIKAIYGTIEEIGQHSDVEPNKPYCAGLSQEYIDDLNELYCK